MADLLEFVDRSDFRGLFIEELGWDNPDRSARQYEVDGQSYKFDQIAGFKGLRIWACSTVPSRKVQRALDVELAKDSQERLVIFNDEYRQEWRWPRRSQTGAVNARLLAHEHLVGNANEHLASQLQSIRIDFDSEPSLVELLSRMRAAFDIEAETASVAAARLMGRLYSELEPLNLSEEDATLLLARLLFLLFADDTDMWEKNLFKRYIETTSTAESLAGDLERLFKRLNTRATSPRDNTDIAFRYVNGGLFADELSLPQLTPNFRDRLLEACEFDWALISPAVFGSMFQTVKDKEARREGGEHYTTEDNILRTIEPLFLDDLKERLDSAWDDKAGLTRLHNEIGTLRFLDPACGCGNFLIVAYRELRALELEILKRRRDLDVASGVSSGYDRSQMTLDVRSTLKVSLTNFFGIELYEWPARIAETALLLVDHLANQRMEQEFGIAPDPLPITLSPTIVHTNALHLDWADVIEPSSNVYILGNPPFIGQYTKTAAQTADTKNIWGSRYNGYLDYVTCWYAKAVDYYGAKISARWAFVSTNSICQGEAVEFLWRPILEAGWRCRFAHRSVRWQTEAADGAAVHVSIIGFDKVSSRTRSLWTYGEGGKGPQTEVRCRDINPYLTADGVLCLVTSRTAPKSPALPPVDYGNKPTDGGHLSVRADEYEEVANDPIAKQYIRRFIGARELLHDKLRYCLWLESCTDSDLSDSPVLQTRVAGVRQMRLDSTKAATRRKAETPHLFDERRQPETKYLAIPRHFGESRDYFATGRFDSDVICGDANFMTADPDGIGFCVMSSSMFIAWMRAIGGRIKSDLRFSNTFVYNTFPLPVVDDSSRAILRDCAEELVAAREKLPGASLADIYEERPVSAVVRKAHDAIDAEIDGLFGYRSEKTDESERQRFLFNVYTKLNGAGWQKQQ